MSTALVSSLVTRAEELSSPYVSTLRQRSQLVDRTATKVAELAKTYEVEAYVKKADVLADKAAAEATARRERYAQQVKAFEQLAVAKVDTLASSVITLVDRIIPEDEAAEEAFDASASSVGRVRQVPAVVYRRAHRVSGELTTLTKAKAAVALDAAKARKEETAALVLARKEQALAYALARKDAAVTVGRRGVHFVTSFVDDLKDEADLRTLPIRDAMLVRRAQLQLRYRETLAVLAARRGVYTQLAWSKMQEAGLEKYAAELQLRSSAARDALREALQHAQVRAAERSGEVRTLYVEYRQRIVAVSVNAKEQISVRVVAAQSELTGRWEQVKEQATLKYGQTATQVTERYAVAKTQVVENFELAKVQVQEQTQRARQQVEAARAAAKARTAELIAETKRRTQEQKERVEKMVEPQVAQLKERSAAVKAKAVEVAAVAKKETPAYAGQLTTRVLGEARGQQVEKQVATLLEALPVVIVA